MSASRILLAGAGGTLIVVAVGLLLEDGAGRSARIPAVEVRGDAAAIERAEVPASEGRDVARRSSPQGRDDLRAPPREEVGGAYLRVVDEEGAPLADLELVLRVAHIGRDDSWNLQDTRWSRRTGASGLADVSDVLPDGSPADQRLVLTCPAAPELSLDPAVLRFAALGATPQGAERVVATRRPVAAVRGLVVDAVSGAPLPDYHLRLSGWETEHRVDDAELLRVPNRIGIGSREWVTTDPTGRFVSEVGLPPCRLHALTYEKSSVELDHAIGADGRGVEVRVEVDAGPIVLLDFDPPAGLAHRDFLATLRRDGREGVRSVEEISAPGDAHGGQRGNSGNATPVRAGSPPWARILPEQADEPLPSVLVLESRGRRFHGWAVVEDLVRHATEPIQVELERRDVLDLRVVWPEQSEDEERVRHLLVRLVDPSRPEAGAVAAQWIVRQGEERATSFTWIGLPAGRYTLLAGSRGFSRDDPQPTPVELSLDLPREDPVEVTFSLRPPVAKHAVELVVRTASGLPLDGEGGRAELARVSVRGFGHVRLNWSGAEARARFEGVFEGANALGFSWSSGWFPIEPKEREIVVPCEPIEVLVRDDGPSERVRVRVLGPTTPVKIGVAVVGEAGHFLVRERFEPDELRALPDGRCAVELTTGPYAAGSAVHAVEVEMDDHERVWLTDRDVPPPDASGVRNVEIVPRRGGSLLARVVVAAGEHETRQVAAVALFFDGVETAPSDEDGRIVHRFDSPPQVVGVATPGWELLDRGEFYGRGSVFADTGRFTLEDDEVTVLVRREER